MNIRTRLTLQFAIIVALILVLFSIITYYASSTDRKQVFRERLKEKGLTTARLLLDVDEVDTGLLKIIDRHTVSLPDEQIMIFNEEGKLIYKTSDSVPAYYDGSFLQMLKQEGEAGKYRLKKDVIGFVHDEIDEQFYVIVEASDTYGMIKLRNLKYIILISLVISIVITIVAGWFYAGQALKPFSEVVHQVGRITVSNLQVRLPVQNSKDEIGQLASTFNGMLGRLESAFEMQRNFVSNASHEMRTPLTVITGQLEVALMKPRRYEEYHQLLTSILEDIKNLNSLVNGLLDLAQASLDISLMKLTRIRVDEIIWQARSELIKHHPEYQVSIQFRELPDDDSAVTVFGNQMLLRSAFINIMDNGCKFSDDKSVEVLLDVNDNYIIIRFNDKGPGIKPAESASIFQPFYRGSNANIVHGHGLGLSLTRKVIELHKGSIAMDSSEKGTEFTVKLPSIAGNLRMIQSLS